MSRFFGSFIFLLFMQGLCEAEGGEHHRRQQYLFFAPGTLAPETESTIQFGGGAEWLVHKGLGFGVDGGYMTLPGCFSCGLGMLSLDASYHFFPRDESGKVVPFVTGGYTLAFREGTANLLNFGGGLNYWFNDGLGLRVEFRDHLYPGYWDGHLLSFRIGLSIR